MIMVIPSSLRTSESYTCLLSVHLNVHLKKSIFIVKHSLQTVTIKSFDCFYQLESI